MEFLSRPQDRPIHIKWVKHLRDPDEREKFKQALKSSSFVLRVLKDLIEEEERNVTISELTPEDYNSPAWPFKQAFRNGERRGLQVVKELLDFIG